MIFLCAQPDEYYFLWQIELLTYILNSLGIPSRDIHVVIGYNPRMGLPVEFQRFKPDRAVKFTALFSNLSLTIVKPSRKIGQ